MTPLTPPNKRPCVEGIAFALPPSLIGILYHGV